MRYMVVIEQGVSSFGAYVPDLPGCIVVGETEQEVLQLVQEAIDFHLEDLHNTDAVFPIPRSYSKFVETQHVPTN